MKYAFKKARRVRIYDIATGKHRVTLNDFQNCQFTGSQNVVYADGADGAHLAAFDTTKVAGFNGTNGAIDSGYIAMQVGSDEVEVVDGTGISIRSEITTADGKTATLPHKARGDEGNEVKFIYATDVNGMPGESYVQAASESETAFKYEPDSNTITLPTGKFKAGDKIIVDYNPKFSTYKQIDNDSDKFSMTGRVIVDAWFTDLCTELDVPLQVIMEKGKISGEVDLSYGDQAAVQNVAIEALTSACSGESKNLWRLFTYNEEDITDL